MKHTPQEIAMLEEIASAALTFVPTVVDLVDDPKALPDEARLALWALMYAAAPLAMKERDPAWVAPAARRVGAAMNAGFAAAEKKAAKNARRNRK